jgi:glycine cleavage system H protein
MLLSIGLVLFCFLSPAEPALSITPACAILKLSNSLEIYMPVDEIRYSPEHLWVKHESSGRIRLGITRFLQAQLKTALYVDLPEVGTEILAGEPFGTIESSKTVSDLISPLSGRIVEINKNLADEPGLINKEPYEGGWLLAMKLNNPASFNALLTTDEYRAATNNSPEGESCQP